MDELNPDWISADSNEMIKITISVQELKEAANNLFHGMAEGKPGKRFKQADLKQFCNGIPLAEVIHFWNRDNHDRRIWTTAAGTMPKLYYLK